MTPIGLVAYYSMDTDENFNIVDRSPNKHHATIDHAEIMPRSIQRQLSGA